VFTLCSYNCQPSATFFLRRYWRLTRIFLLGTYRNKWPLMALLCLFVFSHSDAMQLRLMRLITGCRPTTAYKSSRKTHISSGSPGRNYIPASHTAVLLLLLTLRRTINMIARRFVYLLLNTKGRFVYRTREGRAVRVGFAVLQPCTAVEQNCRSLTRTDLTKTPKSRGKSLYLY